MELTNENAPICELCDKEWFDIENGMIVEDYESVIENKRCTSCLEEWGNTYPDQV